MQKATWFWCMFLTAALIAYAGCANLRKPLTSDMIRSDTAGVRERYFVPSLGIAEISVHEIILYGPVGIPRSGKDATIGNGSYYQIGSCTKAMTATVLVKLMEQGAVSWDTRLLDIFPEFFEAADPAYREITLADVALHRAGFSSGGDVATIERLRSYHGSLSEYVGELLRKPPRVRRGRFHYSNNGYVTLGAVIERCTGLSYTEAMNMLLFDPLGIKAHFGFPADLGPDQLWGHTSNWGAAAPARPADQSIPTVLWPAGGVSLTLGDFARFVQLHLRGMLGQADAGYSPELIRQLHNTQPMNNIAAGSYAAGWVVKKVNGQTIQWHNGSTGDFMVHMGINRSRKKAVVVVTNVGNSQGEQVCWDIIKTMLTAAPGT